MELTGRRRYRVRKSWGSSQVILQVQEHGICTEWMGNSAHSEHRTYWRDARPEDLTEHDAKA